MSAAAMKSAGVRIAMWSGPRNISTAMMRSWGNRADTFVTDEPLYAHYLKDTRAPHPGADEIIAHYESDWRKVVAWLTGPIPDGKTIWFQKHMAHHLLPHIETEWLRELKHYFLIREPREMLASLIAVTPNPQLADTGLPQQVRILHWVEKNMKVMPPVIDATDVLNDPRGVLRKLCEALSVGFSENMLSWPAGPRASDGIWAKHWYHNVEKTTSFLPHKPKNAPIPDTFTDLLAECEGLYGKLHKGRLR